MLVSAFKRGDERTVLMYLDDWPKMDRRPRVTVSKFTPGNHYHVLSVKFDTLEEAQQHLLSKGYQFGGLVEKHVYATEGG
jgi:hypothetical protein